MESEVCAGQIVAKGLRDGKPIETTVETTGDPAEVRLTADRIALTADNTDLAVVTVAILDAQGRLVPVADNKVAFTLTGPGEVDRRWQRRSQQPRTRQGQSAFGFQRTGSGHRANLDETRQNQS